MTRITPEAIWAAAGELARQGGHYPDAPMVEGRPLTWRQSCLHRARRIIMAADSATTQTPDPAAWGGGEDPTRSLDV